jgi:hypothetical protein
MESAGAVSPPRRSSLGHWSEFRSPGACGRLSKTPRKTFNRRQKRAREGPWLSLGSSRRVGVARARRLCVKQCQLLFARLNFPFELKQDRAAVPARRISCCGKHLFGTFEAGFDFLAARFVSLRHAASPLNPLGPPTQGHPIWRAHTKLAAAVRRGFRGFQMNRRLQSRSRHEFDS